MPGRALDDDFTVLAELNNGGIATITASQVTIGAQNDNGFRVIGTTGTLEWSITDHTDPQALRRRSAAQALSPGGRVRLFPRVDQALSPAPLRPSGGLSRGTRQPAPHARMDDPRRPGRDRSPSRFEHPGIADGVAGMAFIEAAVASSKQDGEWVEVPKVG